jgi:endonuclease YncB( thermonuclease family)
LNQPCGPEAVARITELTVDGTLLRQDPAYPGLDARRRVLYYAFTPDGVSIDETLVSEGLARAARPDATDGENLTALERDAQDNARGCLWQ